MAATLDHRFVNCQNFDLHYVVLRELNCPIDKAACLQVRVAGIVKLTVARELENEPSRKRLKILVQPLDQIDFGTLLQKDEFGGDINRRGNTKQPPKIKIAEN